ncbi:cytochrome P450 [Wolfiporia cocos MD-104 SS10]|uniref:Cytochrome P450 n=1 Tax=Wolfiporia cocos (strain MD-104) TaxID=742152 RepID=A0A2H3JC98_WOLCO|nr:cytochrome P450 [Wolfiporia cocos MD-104 SS10]
MLDPTSQAFYALGLVLAVLYYFHRRTNPLYSIPSLVPSAPLISYVGAVIYAKNARKLLQEGYEKYKGSAFRIPMLDRWVVVVCGATMAEELRKMPDDQMSFIEAAEELVQTKYTITEDVIHHPIHIPVIRGPLTRNIAALIPDMFDEIAVAANELVPARGDEWVTISAYSTMTQLVARTSNRAFIGTTMCRNKEYLDIVIGFTTDVAKGRLVLGFVPPFLKRFVGPLLPWSRNAMRRFRALVTPVVVQRQRELERRGKDWAEKPQDLLTWLVEEAKAVGGSTDLIVQALLTSNFVATHTSSSSLTHALYHIAANPEFVEPLRQEIESAIKSDGWTKAALGKMMKLDSFMRESQRMNGISGISVIRKALQNVKLSDGTIVPAGTICGAVSFAMHHDEDNYADPEVFNPFRFSDMRAEESERVKYQYVNTSPEYISFGHGKHACPGRFFAANELKAVLAHFILNYEMKTEDGRRPEDRWLGTAIVPNPDANIMFKRRQTAGVIAA